MPVSKRTGNGVSWGMFFRYSLAWEIGGLQSEGGSGSRFMPIRSAILSNDEWIYPSPEYNLNK